MIETPAAESAAPPSAAPTAMESPVRRILLELDRRNSWVFLALVALIVTFGMLAPDAFLSVDNFRNIGLDVSTLLVIGVGATFVIAAGGIDLSVGSVLVFSAVVSAKAMGQVGGGGVGLLLVGVLAGVLAGAAWGAFNGLIVTRLRIPALIATLGTLGMALGLAQVLTGGIDLTDVPVNVADFGYSRLLGELPALCLIAGAVAVAGGLLLGTTRFGRHTYAIGSNSEAASRAGIVVSRHLLKVYLGAGALAGLAGFMSLARFGSTTISGHSTDNLQVITGVILGGASLFGGAGTVAGTVVGLLISAVLQNGLVIVGVQSFWQEVATGAVLIAAVYLDQLRRRSRQQS